jgi:alpha-L-fucosidase
VKPGNAQFNESNRQDLTPDDMRFTTKADALYALVMGWPGKEATIPALATSASHGVGRIQNVELLGAGKMKFKQDENTLKVQLPEKQPSEHAIAFKIIGA